MIIIILNNVKDNNIDNNINNNIYNYINDNNNVMIIMII